MHQHLNQQPAVAATNAYKQQLQHHQIITPSSSVYSTTGTSGSATINTGSIIQLFNQLCLIPASSSSSSSSSLSLDGKDTSSSQAPIFSIDVECVATGPQHNKRTVAQIALVDQNCQVKCNLYVKPEEKVFSYLTALTGLTEELIEEKGIPLKEAVDKVKSLLPKEAVLVGQNILKDVQWLKLTEGQDFAGMRDLAGLWRVKNPKYRSFTYFLQHEAKSLLSLPQREPHDAATDAILSVRLYNLYQNIHKDPRLKAWAETLLLNTPREKSFAAKNPVYDRVCMGRRNSCKCGAPIFY